MRTTAPMMIDFRLPDNFPVRGYARIPWSEHERIYAHYGNHQPIERVAERGGFGLNEAAELLDGGDIEVWFLAEEDYPKPDDAWRKFIFSWSKGENKTYTWRAIDRGRIENGELILPKHCLEAFRYMYQSRNPKDDSERIKNEGKIEFINGLLEAFEKK